ncbi:hypothetical protein TWF506_005289 [Arthrobotrys conoides]|uniref:Transmembrane protein n=1 Tax=Arthrobotrys conoides TaxID=74498 RepID=A0AAN8RPT9_9PEZI
MATTISTAQLAPAAPTSSPYLPNLTKSFNNFIHGGTNDCFIQETYINRTSSWESQCYISVRPNAIQVSATRWLEYCCTSGQEGNIFEKVDGCGWQCITNRTLQVGVWWKNCVWDDRSPLLTGYNRNLTGYERPVCRSRRELEEAISGGNNGLRISSRGLVFLALIVPVQFVFMVM